MEDEQVEEPPSSSSDRTERRSEMRTEGAAKMRPRAEEERKYLAHDRAAKKAKARPVSRPSRAVAALAMAVAAVWSREDMASATGQAAALCLHAMPLCPENGGTEEMSSSNHAPQRDGKAPASPVPPSPSAPPLRQSTFSADYWDGFYMG
ncbi:hypothetical protein Taro_020257 [Colocasia esculenta]|uniref:Uncharacterized protein n=1 Tax=Colocasia esculenta TaxID=4460 RepID=A0A843V1U8_COLES|nr:hypothetical protein [Colocasia esculenta]